MPRRQIQLPNRTDIGAGLQYVSYGDVWQRDRSRDLTKLLQMSSGNLPAQLWLAANKFLHLLWGGHIFHLKGRDNIWDVLALSCGEDIFAGVYILLPLHGGAVLHHNWRLSSMQRRQVFSRWVAVSILQSWVLFWSICLSLFSLHSW